MTAVEDLVEETGKLYGYSLNSLEEGLKELSDIELTIETLIDIALDLQKQLCNLIIIRIEPAVPIDDEKNETTKRDDAHSIQHIDNYTLTIGPVSIYSLTETIKDKFEAFDAQKSGIAEIHSSSPFLEKPQSIKTDIIESLAMISKESVSKGTLQKKVSIENNIPKSVFEQKLSRVDKTVISETENLYKDIEKSALIITELKTVYDDIASISVERNKEVKKEIENIQEYEVLDVKGFPDDIHYLSEIIGKTSQPLYTKLSEAYEITDISSLNKILARTSQNDSQPAHSSHDTIKDKNRVLDFSETLDNISKTFHEGISEAYDITDISSLNKILARASEPIGLIEDKSPDDFSSLNTIKSSHRFSDFSAALNTISNRDSQLADIKTDKQEHFIHSEQGNFEIPALRPRGKISTSSD
ncbi:MAG: hypothetical protein J5U19_10095, partial [Candidatus Methanoperedens sp.]|nr:hypothetical protein [Candidatus Methanoperedens sp.]